MIKAIFIDIDSTLLDFEACVATAMEAGLSERGIAFNPKMLETFHSVNNGLWKQIEDKTLTFEELLKIRFNKIFEALGIEGIDGPEFETYFRAMLNKSAIPVSGSVEMLRYLSGKYKIYAASNGPHEQQVGRLKKAGMLEFFDEVFTSELIGHEKPRREFFFYCFDKIGNILPSETVMLGDSLTSDMLGGINYGMKTLWFNPTGKTAPENIKPDYIISSLDEVKNIL